MNQIEAHIGWHDDELITFCHKHGIVVQAATPLARSLPTTVKPGGNAVVTALATKCESAHHYVHGCQSTA